MKSTNNKFICYEVCQNYANNDNLDSKGYFLLFHLYLHHYGALWLLVRSILVRDVFLKPVLRHYSCKAIATYFINDVDHCYNGYFLCCSKRSN
jgi:hypothetical protein